MRQINRLWKLFLKGFAITSLTPLFVSIGVYFILFILGILPISRNMTVFLTVLLYALAFAVAKAGMKLKVNFNLFSGSKDDGDSSLITKQAPGRKQPHILRLLAFIWLFTGICSVLWLTPAFIIFWYSLHYPHEVIMLFSFVFSVFATILYYFIKDDIINIKDCFVYFTGSSSGVITAVLIIYYFMSNRIIITWE